MNAYEYLVKHFPEIAWARAVRDLVAGIHDLRPKEQFSEAMAKELIVKIVLLIINE